MAKSQAVAEVECANCGAENQEGAVCHSCGCPPGVTNVMGVNEAGQLVATGEVLEGGKRSKHKPAAATAETKKQRRARVAREKRASEKKAAA